MRTQTILLIFDFIAVQRGRKQLRSEANLLQKQLRAKAQRRATCLTCGTCWFVCKNQYPRYRKSRKLETECRCRRINSSQRYCRKLDVVMNYPKLKHKARNTIVASQMHAAQCKITTSRILIQRVLKLRPGKSLIVGNSSKQSRSYTRTGSAEVQR